MVGESYSDLGGQLPDESEKERGRRFIDILRDRLQRKTPVPLGVDSDSRPEAAGSSEDPLVGEFPEGTQPPGTPAAVRAVLERTKDKP